MSKRPSGGAVDDRSAASAWATSSWATVCLANATVGGAWFQPGRILPAPPHRTESRRCRTAAFRLEEPGRGPPRAAAGQYWSNAEVWQELQASCKHVASLLQACWRLPHFLYRPVPRPSTGAVQPASDIASRSTRA
jgi:hypothetical protein